MANIEEKVEEFYKKILDDLDIRHYGKTEKINTSIQNALNNASSKSGGNGKNFPDIRLLLDNGLGRRIPVIIEAKGTKNKLERLDKNNKIIGIVEYKQDVVNKKTNEITHKKGDLDYTAIINYAVNGAVHYGNAILDGKNYNEVIVVGINGTELNKDGVVIDAECKAYYISEKNNRVPKEIEKITKDNWVLFKQENVNKLYEILDSLNLTEKEKELLLNETESNLEKDIKDIHQSLYDDNRLKGVLSTNEKLYLFCGLIMASLKTKGVTPLNASMLCGNNNEMNNDGVVLYNAVCSFLTAKNCSNEKLKKVLYLLDPIFKKKVLWQPINGESLLKTLFIEIKTKIIRKLSFN